MQPWKNESQFGDFIAEQSTFPTAPPSPAHGSATKLSSPRKQDLDSLQQVYAQLQRVESHLKDDGEDVKAIQQLMSFVRGVRKVSPNHTAAQRFEMLNPLRAWLFWLPVMYLQQTRGSPSALVILAHYYTVALVVEPLFPEVGAAYFGSLSLGPIEEIARRLFSINVSQTADSDMQTPLHLMEYPVDMVSKFRQRMGWVQPERTASFPTFGREGYSMAESYHSPVSFAPYDNPSFTYSQERILSMPPESTPTTALSSMELDPYPNHYLGVPSPSGFGGYHSPTASNFGDGAIGYYSGQADQGTDFSLYDAHRSNYGAHQGFVLPTTVWI